MIIVKPVETELPYQPNQPVKKDRQPRSFRFSKHLIIGIAFLVVIGSLLGGTIMLQGQKRVLSQMRMKVPFQPEPNRVTATPIPSPTEKPDPTASWKPYANKSFSIRHPDRFTIKEQILPVSVAYPHIYTSIQFIDQESTITITVAKNTQNYTLTSLSGLGPYLRYGLDIISGKPSKTIKIDTVDAKVTENIPAGLHGTTAEVLAVSNGKVYQVTLEPAKVDSTTFNLMIDSLKFLHQEPSDETDAWKLHLDTTYKYSVKYPTNYSLEFNKVASGASTLTSLYDSNAVLLTNASKFKIEVQDPKNFGQSAVTSKDLLKLSLEDFVNEKWNYNKSASDAAVPNKKVGAIKETKVDGKAAFQFSVTGKYVDDNVSEKLSEEFIFIFTEYNGLKYKIWYPKANTVYTQIFNTFTFTQ